MRTEQPLDYVGYQDADSASQIIQVESSKLTPLLVALAALALLTAGIALGISVVGVQSYSRDYKELERENRLLQLKVDEFRMALMKANIDPNPHPEGESK
jgi:hypothetical protein